MIKVGIIGGAGYTAGELIRLLINHPEVEIAFVHSESNAGNPVADVHEGLIGETSLRFADKYNLHDIDCLFLCSGHGFSRAFWEQNAMPEGLRVVDLAQDFRDESNGYVYGLPELNRNRIASARLIANPGCFATAIQLALLPLAAAGELRSDVAITGITGSTGAGVKPGATTHFSWRNNNLSVYKPFTHQHLIEIRRNLALAAGIPEGIPAGAAAEASLPQINFVPVRGDFPRGIFVMAQLQSSLSADQASAIFNDFYRDAAFTFVSPRQVDLKQVVNTNKAVISIVKEGDRLLVVSAIDNLLKGASGQALQNFNLIFNLPEKTGLNLKPSAF